METFATQLKKLRNEKQMTQGELATALGDNINTIKSWEIGRRKPKLKEATRIADYFGVTVSYLVGDSVFRDNSEHSSEGFWDDDELIDALTQDIKRMRLAGKMEVFDYIQELKSSQPVLFTPEEDPGGTVIIVKEKCED